jgi:hypothetical protein
MASGMGSRLTDLNRWPSLYNDSHFEIHCAARDFGCVVDSLVNRLINLLLNLLCLLDTGFWAFLFSLRASQVAQAKTGLVGNGVLDCAFENMAA